MRDRAERSAAWRERREVLKLCLPAFGFGIICAALGALACWFCMRF